MDISIVRGTSLTISVYVDGNIDGEEFTPLEGDIFRFGLKKSPGDNSYLIEKEYTIDDWNEEGYFDMEFLPTDTMGLSLGSYWFDIGLQRDENYYMVIKASKFNITTNITKWDGD